MPDDSKQIGIIGLDSDGEANVREPIFIQLSSYRNKKYLDIRKYYFGGDDWKPSKKGVTFDYDQIYDFIRIIKENDLDIKEWFGESE